MMIIVANVAGLLAYPQYVLPSRLLSNDKKQWLYTTHIFEGDYSCRNSSGLSLGFPRTGKHRPAGYHIRLQK